jgi:3-hydroxyacyl-[acyl-carrier-protein] dehydratase
VSRRYCGHLEFDSADGIYADHFPGVPIVPGTLIVHGFLMALEQWQGARPRQIRRFRFNRFVSPGTYSFEMENQSDKIVCTLLDGRQAVATGEILL